MKTRNFIPFALLSLLIFIFSSCSVDNLFKPKYDECTGQENSFYEGFANPEFYELSNDDLTGHLQSSEESHVCNFSIYLSDVCVASPINIDFGVTLNNQEMEATGFTLNDVELSSYFKVFKEGEMPDGQHLYKEDISYQQENFSSRKVYICKDVIGLVEKIDFETIVDLEFQVEISFKADPENDPEGNNGYFFYNFLEYVGLVVTYHN